MSVCKGKNWSGGVVRWCRESPSAFETRFWCNKNSGWTACWTFPEKCTPRWHEFNSFHSFFLFFSLSVFACEVCKVWAYSRKISGKQFTLSFRDFATRTHRKTQRHTQTDLRSSVFYACTRTFCSHNRTLTCIKWVLLQSGCLFLHHHLLLPMCRYFYTMCMILWVYF